MKGSILSKTLLLLLVLLAGTLLSNSTLLASDTLSGVVVCLDPGHGGDDPGAVNTDYDLRESDVNLDVVYGLKYLLENEGAEVVMTRTDDNFRTNEDRYTFCNEQMATILVSVHTNSVTDPTWDGSIALYAPNRDADLAHAIHDAMYPILHDTAPDQEAFIDFGLDNFASGVLFKCNMPSAMMEPLFMSNSAEAPLLQQPIFDDPAVAVK
jgi:N-acetylmuramoyl-L-alanine amidase